MRKVEKDNEYADCAGTNPARCCRRPDRQAPLLFPGGPAPVGPLKAELGVRDNYAVARHFGSDAFQLFASYQNDRCRKQISETAYTDMFGSRFYVSLQRDGLSCERVDRPALAPDGEALPLDSIRWPDSAVLDLPACIKNAAEARESGMAVYGGIWASIFTRSRELLGEETFFITMFEKPDYIRSLVDRITDFYLEINKTYLDACHGEIDVYYYGSDFGTQRSLFISPEHFRAFFKPNLKRIADQAKGYNLPVMFHTCGCVKDIIPDLIDCGIDILDPIQVSAEGMSPENLIEFKGKIAFNGGVSTQTTLPFGSAEPGAGRYA